MSDHRGRSSRSGPVHDPEAPGLCLLTETYHPVIGGGETQARELAQRLVERNWRVAVFAWRSDPTTARRALDGGVLVRRVPPSGAGRHRKWSLVLTTLPALLGLRRRYDLILVSGFRLLGIPALVCARLLGKRCVLKADSLGEMSGEYFAAGLAKIRLSVSSPPFRLFLALRNRLFRSAGAFVAVTSEIAAELARSGVDPDSVHRIPNGVDTERFHPVSPQRKRELRTQLDLPAERTIVTYVGRLVSYKGLPTLLEAWRSLAARRSDGLLVLAGAGGFDIHACEGELRELVRRHRLEEQVRFAGEVREVTPLLQTSDAFVLPSENEAFGLALVEAMSCGLPAVSTAVGGLRDIARDDENALVVPPRDAQALEAALQRLLSQPQLRERLGRAARETAVSCFSLERVAELYERLACALLGLGDAPRLVAAAEPDRRRGSSPP